MTKATNPENDRRAPVRSSSGESPDGHRSLAVLCARHRRLTVLLATLAVAVGVLLLGTGLHTTSGAEQLVGDSRAAADLLEDADFGEQAVEQVVVGTRTGTFGDAQVSALGQEIRAAYTGLEQVDAVSDPVLSADRTTLLVTLQLSTAASRDDDVDEATVAAARALLPVTDRLAAAHPELEVGQTGSGSLEIGVGEQVERDFHRAELLSIPVTLVILLLAFGSVVAAFVPVLLGIAAVVTALGVSALISHSYPVDQNTQSLVLLIGLAVGVDYALFVIRRSRQERLGGRSLSEAIGTAGRTAGRAVLISGITVVVSMAGMLVAGGLYTSLAIGAMIVVAIAVLASATVLPALLAVLGDRIDRWRLPFTGRPRRSGLSAGASGGASGEERSDGWWGRLAATVVRRPAAWALVSGALLVALALPALGMRTTLPGLESLPQDLPQVRATARLVAAFPQEGSTIDLVVGAPATAAGQVRQALDDAWAQSRTIDGLDIDADADPATQVSQDRTVSVLSLATGLDAASDARAADLVGQVRAQVVAQVRTDLADVPGAQVHLAGLAENTELSAWMDSRLLPVVGFVLALTFVVMVASFGSVWLALATVALNLLSVGAAYGAIAGIFQNGWAEDLLGFTSTGSIAAWLPLLMFVVLFGLSMDYHVFVVSRVREARRAGLPARQAVRAGVAGSAGTVTSAAIVMIAVFAIFATMSMLELKQLGVGLATAVLVDATVVRGVLLPAVLALLGERAHRGSRRLPTLHD